MGVPGDIAPRVAGWFDQRMGESMLALYRSAVDIATTWPPGVEHIETPGLAMLATADPFRNHELFRAAVERARARTVELEGLGHWWMLQNPGLGARVLEEFWASLVC
jgi:pimeloyl-ACP methyl ester carboxylesterase